jgi:YtcA family
MKRNLVRHHLRYRGGDGPSSPLFLKSLFAGYSVLLLPGLLTGCSRAPTFDIVGSFFPAWLVCLVLGILLVSFARWLLLRLKVALALPILVYPSLAAMFTFLLWLIFFS